MGYSTRSSRVRLDTIPVITFLNGEMTASRRTSPVPQLTCEGRPCSLFQPDVVQCKNQGGSGSDIEWSMFHPESPMKTD